MSRRQLTAEQQLRAEDKAWAFLAEHGQRLVLALDLVGWKIVRQDTPSDHSDRYPGVFYWDPRIKGEIPAWIDLFEADPRKRPPLRLIVDTPPPGGKPNGGGRDVT